MFLNFLMVFSFIEKNIIGNFYLELTDYSNGFKCKLIKIRKQKSCDSKKSRILQ